MPPGSSGVPPSKPPSCSRLRRVCGSWMPSSHNCCRSRSISRVPLRSASFCGSAGEPRSRKACSWARSCSRIWLRDWRACSSGCPAANCSARLISACMRTGTNSGGALPSRSIFCISSARRSAYCMANCMRFCSFAVIPRRASSLQVLTGYRPSSGWLDCAAATVIPLPPSTRVTINRMVLSVLNMGDRSFRCATKKDWSTYIHLL